MIDPLVAYQLFSSIKTHYQQESYDFFKYGLNKKMFSAQAFEKRNDQYLYAKLSKKFDKLAPYTMFLATNFMYNRGEVWIGDLLDNFETCEGVYLKHLSYFSSPVRNYREDMEKVIQLRSPFELPDPHNPPGSIRLLLNNKVKAQTLILANRVYSVDFLQRAYDNSSSISLTKNISLCLLKFSPFVKVRDKEELDRLGSAMDSQSI